ncbi:hypothetical protein A2U01_0000928 [Trifolium medium]|uniref:Uncharacterized protein n=1 Tax=Trifolium medium TaxID=97028 RepID=A0A392LYZ5_9FABA|nr:hypothetical protein [Trifolium medium]
MIPAVLVPVMVGLWRYLFWELDSRISKIRSGTLGQDSLAGGEERAIVRERARGSPRLPWPVVPFSIPAFVRGFPRRVVRFPRPVVLRPRMEYCISHLPLFVLNAALEQVPFHIIGRVDLDRFFVEPFDVFTKRFIFTLYNSFQGCFRFWLCSGSSEVNLELVFQAAPRGDRLSRQSFVPGEGSLPQGGREEPALDGSSNLTIVQVDFEILNVLVRVCQPVVRVELGWLLEPCREWYPHDVTGERTAEIVIIIPNLGARRRVIVVPRRCRATIPSVVTTLPVARRCAMLHHQPCPHGEECGLASCFDVEADEAVPEPGASGECCHDEEEVSQTCDVSARENCSSEDADSSPARRFGDIVVAVALRQNHDIVFFFGEGRCLFSISGIAGVVCWYFFLIISRRREDGVVFPRGRAVDGVLMVVDTVDGQRTSLSSNQSTGGGVVPEDTQMPKSAQRAEIQFKRRVQE